MQQKVYFKGLNGLRFLAASLVLFWHANRIVTPNGFNYNPLWFFLSQNGTNAVTFFFVLSGFLISYLLISEYENTGTVSVKRFYLKRVLRIWPVYYFLVVFVQILLPFIFHLFGQPYKQFSNLSTFFYLIILPNVPYALSLGIGKIGHLWSIGVEEQFYAIWAPIVKSVKKNIVKVCFFIIALKILLYYVLLAVQANYPCLAIKWTSALINQFAIEKMAMGGIGAYLVYYHKDRLMKSAIFSVPFQLLFIGVLLFHLSASEAVLKNGVLHALYHLLFGFPFSGLVFVPILFLYVILNTSLNAKSIIRTENKYLNYLGEISYGLYMYHMIAVYTAEAVMMKLKLQQGSILFGLVFFVIAFGINLTISSLSYRYFESRLLKLRPKD